jgi:hypothetical protein
VPSVASTEEGFSKKNESPGTILLVMYVHN